MLSWVELRWVNYLNNIKILIYSDRFDPFWSDQYWSAQSNGRIIQRSHETHMPYSRRIFWSCRSPSWTVEPKTQLTIAYRWAMLCWRCPSLLHLLLQLLNSLWIAHLEWDVCKQMQTSGWPSSKQPTVIEIQWKCQRFISFISNERFLSLPCWICLMHLNAGCNSWPKRNYLSGQVMPSDAEWCQVN